MDKIKSLDYSLYENMIGRGMVKSYPTYYSTSTTNTFAPDYWETPTYRVHPHTHRWYTVEYWRHCICGEKHERTTDED